MKIEEKIDKICEMLKELVKLEAIDEIEVNQMFLQLKIALESIKELKGE